MPKYMEWRQWMAGVASLLLVACTASERNVKPVLDLPKLTRHTTPPWEMVSSERNLTLADRVWIQVNQQDPTQIHLNDEHGHMVHWSSQSFSIQRITVPHAQWTSPMSCAQFLCDVGLKTGGWLRMTQHEGAVVETVRWDDLLLGPTLRTPDHQTLALSQDNTLYAYDDQMRVQWSLSHPTPSLTIYGTAPLLMDKERVYVGYADGTLAAINRNQGNAIWHTALSESVPTRSDIHNMADILSAPVLAQDTLFVSYYQGDTVAVEAGNGQVRWRQSFGSHYPLAWGGDRILVRDQKDHIKAFEAQYGALLWEQTALADYHITHMWVIEGVPYVLTAEGWLIALDLDSGEITRYMRLSSQSEGEAQAAVVAGHYVVVYWPSVGRLAVYQPYHHDTQISHSSPRRAS